MQMSKTIGTTRAALFALAMCGVLGFGASTALAGPLDGKQFCDRLSIGTCQSITECRANCVATGYTDKQASCKNGCCYCQF
jgi:hypothetical protein